MGEMTDKTKGNANKAVGAVKSAVGKATGNGKLRTEGDAQKIKGDAQKAIGALRGALGNKI